MNKLHPKAVQIFDYINERSANDIVPSIREICDALQIKSTSTVHKYINELVEAGMIEKMDFGRRALRVAGKNAIKIPLIGVVTAGQPITAVENISEYIPFSPTKKYQENLFALNVRGDSMIDAGILDGDIAVIQQTPIAENGDMVVALIEGEDATIKEFHKENGKFRLQPKNDKYEPIILDSVEIIGKVISIIRYY